MGFNKGFIVDLHVHTIASGHAYSTLMDYVHAAKEHGIAVFGLSDHGPAMPGGPHIFHIGNQTVIPRVLEGVHILRGVEANILNFDGQLDVSEEVLSRLDYAIASLHDVVLAPGSLADNTRAVIEAIKHPKVRVIGHMGNPKFPVDYKAVVAACVKENVAIEVNNSTFKGKSRMGSEENCADVAKLAYESGAKLILGSDAHIHTDLANFTQCFKLLDQLHIPRDYPINYRRESFVKWLGFDFYDDEK